MGEKINSLKQRWARIHTLEQATAVLQWDMETYMPEEGVNARAEHLSLLSEIAHQWLISDETARIIEDAENEIEGDYFSDDVSMVRVARRLYEREAKIPLDLVSRMARTTAKANSVWIKSRQESDFSSFAPILEEVIGMNREKAECLGYREHIYDALLDLYEPEYTTRQVEDLFSGLKISLLELLNRIRESRVASDSGFLRQQFPVEKQEEFGLMVLLNMGYNFKRGRQDRSAHPFTTSFSPYDVRITTRFSEDDLLSALFSTVHEGGHALYEQGLPIGLLGTPLCQSISLGVHESQSRLWENIVARSRGFWKKYLPSLKDIFSPRLDSVGLETFYRAINRVSPGLIRVESDEVTYNLHIMIRFDLEKELISGNMAVSDIPEAWNSRYKEYLGIEPEDDASGCLQDIHWAHGAFGYFPTYTLGNLFAAQLFDRALRDIPLITDDIEKGDFTGLLGWLRENIHSAGFRYTPAELAGKVTGSIINPDYFIKYLNDKFSEIYEI